MIKTVIILFLLMLNIDFSYSQLPIRICRGEWEYPHYGVDGCINYFNFNFENDGGDSSSYFIHVDTNNVNNIWQVGKPQKNTFNNPYNGINAIVTDTINPYPINSFSFFKMKIILTNTFGDGIFSLAFTHKFNTDSLNDRGYIEFSVDNGQTWQDIVHLSDTIYHLYDVQVPEFEFSGNSSSWPYNDYYGWLYGNINFRMPECTQLSNCLIDTLDLRFVFVSDSIQNNKEGWMIDDIQVGGWYESITSKDIENNNSIIFPNPISENSTIELNSNSTSCIIEIYNLSSNLVKRFSSNSQSVTINKKDFSQGMYFYKILDNNNKQYTGKFIVI